MKYVVILNGNEIVTGDTYNEIVEKMRDGEFVLPKEESRLPFMKRVQGRIKEFSRLDIRICCSEHFVEDLCEAGAIVRKDD